MFPKYYISALDTVISMDGLVFCLGMAAAIVWSYFRLKTLPGVDARFVVVRLAFWSVMLGLLGARITYVLLYPELFGPELVRLLYVPGLAVFGSLPGLAVAVLVTAWQTRVSGWHIADVLAPPIALMIAFKRVGCWLAGCCYGLSTNLPWAAHYPQSHVTHGVGVHPVPVYEILLLLILLPFLLRLSGATEPRGTLAPGTVACVFLLAYGLIRFVLEFVRADSLPTALFAPFSVFQVVGIFVATLALCWLADNRPKRKSI